MAGTDAGRSPAAEPAAPSPRVPDPHPVVQVTGGGEGLAVGAERHGRDTRVSAAEDGSERPARSPRPRAAPSCQRSR